MREIKQGILYTYSANKENELRWSIRSAYGDYWRHDENIQQSFVSEAGGWDIFEQTLIGLDIVYYIEQDLRVGKVSALGLWTPVINMHYGEVLECVCLWVPPENRGVNSARRLLNAANYQAETVGCGFYTVGHWTGKDKYQSIFKEVR